MISESRDGPRAVIRLNRPDKANALSAAMLEELATRIAALNSDSDLRALILTGTGRIFSAGADLDEVIQGLATDPNWEKLSNSIENSPHLTISALNGTAAGGSLGMVFACDLRVAAPHAKFFYPAINLGVLPQPSDPKRLTKLVGQSRAKLMLLAGEKIEASEAMAMGLVDKISEEPLAEAVRLSEASCLARDGHLLEIKRLT